MMQRSKIKGAAATLAALALTLGGVAIAMPASATPAECVPSEAIEAWTEITPDIEHPAVGEPTIVVDNPDYVPAVPAVWANFSPNDKHAPFVGPPTYPTDERGTWHDHGQLPPGQAGPDGVYANGNPDKGGNWFYRQAEVPAQGEPTITVDNPDYVAAYTEDVPDIEHPAVPAVTCEPEEEEPPVVVNDCSPTAGTHSTNLAPMWSDVDTRSAGHYEYVDGGLRVWTDDASSNAKVSLGLPVSFPLHDTGVLDLAWTGTSPAPGINLFVNFGADGMGTLVYESVYGQDLWLTNGSSAAVKANAPVNGGGNGSQWHGTIDQWLSVYPEAQVVGLAFSLGSGVLGDGVITSITAGCATHTFDHELTPLPEDSIEYGVWSEPVYDCDTELGTGVPIYREVTTTTYTRDEQGIPLASSSTTIEEGVFIVDENALDGLECPVPTPEPEPEPEPAPAGDPGDGADWGDRTTDEPSALAVTGSTIPLPLIGGGLIALLLGALGITVAATRRR